MIPFKRFFLYNTALLAIGTFPSLSVHAEPGKKEAVQEDRVAGNFLEAIRGEFQRHNYKKVISLYRQFITEEPDRFIPIVARAFYTQALADTGEIDEAIRTLGQLLADMPPQVDPQKLRYDLANLLFLQKRYEEARLSYQKVILQSASLNEIAAKAKERMEFMKEKESNAKKKDHLFLQLLDIDTSLDAGEVPDGAETIIRKVLDQGPSSIHFDFAKRLQARVQEIRVENADALLDEARRLFDEEKKYGEVRELLDRISRSYRDVSDMTSVEALRRAVEAKMR